LLSIIVFRATNARLKSTTPSAGQVISQSRLQLFPVFCLVGGWAVVYGLSIIVRGPSVGAVIEKGGAIWILGVMLGLRQAMMNNNYRRGILWALALAVYPALMLMVGGFMSYGSTAVIIALSVLVVSARHYWRAIAALSMASVLSVSIFVNYFTVRSELRDAVWGGAALSQRIDAIMPAVTGFSLINLDNPDHVKALDVRLNQNYFIGVADERLQAGAIG